MTDPGPRYSRGDVVLVTYAAADIPGVVLTSRHSQRGEESGYLYEVHLLNPPAGYLQKELYASRNHPWFDSRTDPDLMLVHEHFLYPSDDFTAICYATTI